MLREIIFSCLALQMLSTPAIAAPKVDKPTAGKPSKVAPPAKVVKTKPATPKGGTPLTSINLPTAPKKENLVGERRYNTSQTKVQFDATVIDGEAVRPVVSSISSQKSDQDFDLIPIRKRWHTEMIQSAGEF